MDLSKFISLLSTIINQVVYRLKASSDSTYMKYKTRLVVCKNEQQHGLDFQKTFVPITKMEHNSLFHWLFNMVERFTYGCKSTFFNRYIKKDVYVKHHCGFIIPNLEDKLCKLKRPLYKLH